MSTDSAFETSSKILNLIVVGYAIATIGFLAFLTINGMSGISEVAPVVTAVLIAVGLLLPASCMFLLRREIANTQLQTRRSFSLQGIGLIILFSGVVLVAVSSSLSDYVVGGILLIASDAAALTGVILLKKHVGIPMLQKRKIDYLVLATVFLFSGVGLIVISNIAFYYVLSQVENTVYADVGATISACGCVLAAYSFLTSRSRN